MSFKCIHSNRICSYRRYKVYWCLSLLLTFKAPWYIRLCLSLRFPDLQALKPCRCLRVACPAAGLSALRP